MAQNELVRVSALIQTEHVHDLRPGFVSQFGSNTSVRLPPIGRENVGVRVGVRVGRERWVLMKIPRCDTDGVWERETDQTECGKERERDVGLY